ncbi:unnamed protein product [Rotaria magnacalcarata]|uniref:Uncharacterized protein n=2 Tax=Rotaria magnacalcarata TaxID=392030 RepID=A0A819Y0G0_9BILA|nr:unnamed protein product [Rotaria magnacalcarata]
MQQGQQLLISGMDKAKQEKLDLNMYGQIWCSNDLNSDRLTSELNKIFNYNQAETSYRNTTDKYFDFHEEYAKSLAASAGFEASANILGIASGNADISTSFNKAEAGATGKTTHDAISLTDIRKYLHQNLIETE